MASPGLTLLPATKAGGQAGLRCEKALACRPATSLLAWPLARAHRETFAGSPNPAAGVAYRAFPDLCQSRELPHGSARLGRDPHVEDPGHEPALDRFCAPSPNGCGRAAWPGYSAL